MKSGRRLLREGVRNNSEAVAESGLWDREDIVGIIVGSC